MQISPKVIPKNGGSLLANIKHSYNDPYIKSRDYREKSITVAEKKNPTKIKNVATHESFTFIIHVAIRSCIITRSWLAQMAAAL